MLRLFKIQGDSMLPVMAGGDFIVASHWFLSLKVGDIVVVEHPTYGKIIKRIRRISKTGQMLLLYGQNKDSISSEQMGWIKYNQIIGKVVFSITR